MTAIATAGRNVVLDDPEQWDGLSFDPPDSVDVAQIQREIDSIVGTTRGNQIVRLVWNGDKRYWRTIVREWDVTGVPVEYVKRPIVLFRSIYGSHRKWERDVFVPRWLLLTRIEPEQYVPGWERSSKIWDPERNRYIQIKPPTPPDEWYEWFMTIAEHGPTCCMDAEPYKCYGKYAPPRASFPELYKIMEGVDRLNLKNDPFASPDSLTSKLKERSVNDYAEQSLKNFDAQVSKFADSIPHAPLRQIMHDQRKREIDDMLKQGVKR